VKTLRNRSFHTKAKSFQRCLICSLLAVAFYFPVALSVQARSQNEIIAKERADLLPLTVPDVSQLEEKVRQQIVELQDNLRALLKQPSTDARNLSEAYGVLGQVYQLYTFNAAAQTCFLNAQRLANKDFRWAYFSGYLFQQQNNLEKAIEQYETVRRLKPDYVAAAFNSGNLFLQQNRLQAAVDSFKAVLAVNENAAAAYYGLGQASLSLRDYQQAVKNFEKALSLVPEANRIHYAMAMAYRGLKDFEKAQFHLERQGTVGVKIFDPLIEQLQELVQGERIHLLRGKQAFEAHRFSEALSEYGKAVEANPKSSVARVNFASSLAQTGNLKEAIAQFEAALASDPENLTANYNLGFLYAGQKLFQQAITRLQTVLKRNPADMDARFLLAQTFLANNNRDEALVEFSIVSQTRPENEDALLEQAKLLAGKRLYAEALEKLEQGYSKFPQRGRTIALLSYLLATCAKLELRNGARALQMAMTVYQATGQASHGAIVALALAESGRCSEAAEWQKRMIELAEKEQQKDLAAKLKNDLPGYEMPGNCRPQSQEK
jgi:tetratricopeptide (TPR) repeat protein